MKSKSFKTKIVIVPLVFILAVILFSSFYYIKMLQNYHRVNIESFREEYYQRQYSKIKNDVGRIVNYLEYARRDKETLAEVEQKALDRVNHLDMTNSPYMFILKLLKPDGGKDFAKIIFYNNKAEPVGMMVSDDKVDQDNKPFLKEVLKDLRKQGFSYMIYKHPKPSNGNINKKLTLFYLYKPLQWIITSSVFLDEVNEAIEKKDLELESHIRRAIITSVSLLLIFSLLVLIIFYRISSQVYKKIEDNEQQLLKDNKTLEEQRKELAESTNHLKLVVEGAQLGTWDWNIKTDEVVFNERWAEITGYTLEEVEPKSSSWKKLLHPDEEEEVNRLLTDHLEGRTPTYIAEHRLHHKAGHWIWGLDVGKVFERDEEGKPVRAVGILLDVTPQKEAEEQKIKIYKQEKQLEKLESLKTMAGAIAHRFNNSMMIIEGNLDLAAQTLADDSPAYRMISNAAQESMRASQVGTMMLSYLGQRLFKPEDALLETPVNECVATFRKLLPATISLRFTPPKQPLYCSMDLTQIKEAIESILTNALESLGESPGTIDIAFGTDFFTVDSFPLPFQNAELQDGMYAYCQIKDSGHGISPKNLSRIFEPFYTTKFVGRGLGLSSTVGIMLLHHGAITVESVPSQGTTVRLLLPVKGRF